MTEKENPDSLNSLLENYGKQQSINTVAGWERVKKRIAFYRNRQTFFRFVRNSAAVLLPLFLIFQYALMPMLDKQNTDNQTITVTSAPGMITKTVLPDGSQVWLNAQSSLTYPQRFSQKSRTVQLTGEAYFKVVSDKKHRFNVETPNRMTVSAYGTEFNVNAYANENRHEVTLAEGHVEVTANNLRNHLSLQSGQKATLNMQTGAIFVSPTDTYVDTAWKDGKMVFRREKLDKIAEKLSRKFGVTISLEGEKLKEYEYTATFTHETLEDILDLLQRSAPVTYTLSRQKQLDNETFTQRTVVIKTK